MNKHDELPEDDEFDYGIQDDFVDIMQPVIWLVVALILIAVVTR